MNVIDEIKNTLNRNEIINEQMCKLDNEYDKNIEHIHYVKQDIEAKLCNQCNALLSIDIRKHKIVFKMQSCIDVEDIKNICDFLNIDINDIRIESIIDSNVDGLYINLILDI